MNPPRIPKTSGVLLSESRAGTVYVKAEERFFRALSFRGIELGAVTIPLDRVVLFPEVVKSRCANWARSSIVVDGDTAFAAWIEARDTLYYSGGVRRAR